MMNLISVGVGGLLGSVTRYLVNIICLRNFGMGFPWQTLAVNIIGSFFMGVIFTLNAKQSPFFTGVNYYFLTTGLLGGFTTFSAFSIETVNLMRQGNVSQALLNILLNLVLCLLMTWLGVSLVQKT